MLIKHSGSLRQFDELLRRGLLLYAGWLILGASGLVLLWLWSLVWRRGPVDHDWAAFLDAAPLQRARLDPHRVLLISQGGRRLEVFRDEVGAADWSALRRRCRLAAEDR